MQYQCQEIRSAAEERSNWSGRKSRLSLSSGAAIHFEEVEALSHFTLNRKEDFESRMGSHMVIDGELDGVERQLGEDSSGKSATTTGNVLDSDHVGEVGLQLRTWALASEGHIANVLLRFGWHIGREALELGNGLLGDVDILWEKCERHLLAATTL